MRSEYATSTPGLSRHMSSRGSQSEMLQPPPHSPLSPGSTLSPTMAGSLASPSHDGSNGLGGSTTGQGPPLGETQLIHHLSSADGHMVRPDIHARVDKGFFLADRDWTCYRRNYFSVICSYSLTPANHSLPLFLRRTTNSAPEHIVAFAMCISAVVDSPGGKTVELVQHTPKRDKGPQQKPNKIKLSPQPAGGMSFGGGSSSGMQQPPQAGGLEHDYQYGGPQTQQHQQHIGVFDRIQFKSATANNGKRRAAQQYYHLLVELYADVGNASAAAQQPGAAQNDGSWVKIAYKMSAPMVVRGRSPGHYADGQRTGSASSPGGGSTGGNLQQGGGHHAPHTSGGPTGYSMDNGGMNASNPGQSGGMGHHQHQHGVSSPPTSTVHNPASTHSESPASHYADPAIDPELNSEQPPIGGVYPQPGYTLVPTYYETSPVPPLAHMENGYQHNPNSDSSHNNHSHPHNSHSSHQSAPRKSEHALETSAPEYENGDANSYAPPGLGDNYRKSVVKDEYPGQTSLPWLGSGARERAGGYPNVMYPKCGTRFETVESSKGVFPDISPL